MQIVPDGILLPKACQLRKRKRKFGLQNPAIR
jgi:hypothetical protein